MLLLFLYTACPQRFTIPVKAARAYLTGMKGIKGIKGIKTEKLISDTSLSVLERSEGRTCPHSLAPEAFKVYAYTQSEIAAHLGSHKTTISKIVSKTN